MRAVDLELFKPELVFFDFEATNSDKLFEKLANELAPYGYIKDSWLAGIKEREETYPTGLAFETVSVALGLTAHEEGQVAVLQALMGVFLDTDAVSRIMAQTTPEGMIETMRELCS